VIVCGDARRIPLADASVQCVVTSPPYWVLRDYGLTPSVWGGKKRCAHVWGELGHGGESYKGKKRWQHGVVGDGRPNERGENYGTYTFNSLGRMLI